MIDLIVFFIFVLASGVLGVIVGDAMKSKRTWVQCRCGRRETYMIAAHTGDIDRMVAILTDACPACRTERERMDPYA